MYFYFYYNFKSFLHTENKDLFCFVLSKKKTEFGYDVICIEFQHLRGRCRRSILGYVVTPCL